MVIQIRGTSGSGKTTVMKEIMKAVPDDWWPEHIPGRKQPYYYVMPEQRLLVLGHYETATGGCDTLGGGAPKVWECFVTALGKYKGYDVLCEGLMLSEDVKWTCKMNSLDRAHVVCYFLNTNPDLCIERIENRRKAAGRDRTKSPLNVPKTLKRGEYIEGVRHKLIAEGIETHRVSSRAAAATIMYKLGFTLTTEGKPTWVRSTNHAN